MLDSPRLRGRTSRAAGQVARSPARWSLVALLAAGCVQATTVTDPSRTPGERRSLWVHQFVLGLVRGQDVDVRDHCPAGLARLEAHSDPLTLGLSALTLGIWVPRRVVLICARP